MDTANLTPYILAALAVLTGIVGWLCREAIKAGKDVVRLQTAFGYYLERTGKGAAMILDSQNPTPPEIRALLKKHVEGALSQDERERLIAFLRRLKNDSHTQKSERSAAIQLLAAMETMPMIQRH